MKRPWVGMGWTIGMAACMCMASLWLCAQENGSDVPARPSVASADISGDVRALREMVEELRNETRDSRAEVQQLRQELQNTRAMLEQLTASRTAIIGVTPEAAAASVPRPTQSEEAPLAARVEKLEDAASLLTAKVDDQYRTKVEAGAKYRVRLSGIVLLNAFHNHGTADNFDTPSVATPLPWFSPSGFGATLRQSEVGVEVFGPELAGARTSASVKLDFAGGMPPAPNGVVFGYARMQTAALHMDWEHTSIIAGQDSLFLAPQSPTSFASLATPAFAYAGNLWGWIPQIRVEQRFDLTPQQKITLQAGILDNLVWERPSDSYSRVPGPGEQSGQPAYGLRAAWAHALSSDRELHFGTAGYYSRQDWSFDRYVDGWAGIGEWQIPLAAQWTITGEFYRGRGAGGLGAAIGRTVLYGVAPAYGATPLRGADSAGGWTQLKWKLTPKLEFNGAVAEDDLFSRDVRGFASEADNGIILGRNRGALGNVVFRPRSNLLVAMEYKRLRSFPVYEPSLVTNQINLAMGILF